MPTEVEIIGEITDIETIAVGRSIRELNRLQRLHGSGRWRKLKVWQQCVYQTIQLALQKFIGMKLTVLEKKRLKSNGLLENKTMENKKESPKFVVCIKNDGYQASLERRKIYEVVADTDAQKHQLIRVIDESGEDYLFPSSFFSPISLPQSLVKELSLSA